MACTAVDQRRVERLLVPLDVPRDRLGARRAEERRRDLRVLARELERELAEARPLLAAELGRPAEDGALVRSRGMPVGGAAVGQEAAAERRAVDDADSRAPRDGQQLEKPRVVQAVVVVDEGRVRVAVGEDAVPQVHRVDAEAHRADAALALQLPQGLEPFAERPLGVLPALVLDVVEVHDVEVLDPEAPRALVEGSPDAGAGVVEGVVAVGAGARVLADLGGEEVAGAGHLAQRAAEDGLRPRGPVGRRDVEVVDAGVEGGVHRAHRLVLVHRAEDSPERRGAEAEARNLKPGPTQRVALHGCSEAYRSQV